MTEAFRLPKTGNRHHATSILANHLCLRRCASRLLPARLAQSSLTVSPFHRSRRTSTASSPLSVQTSAPMAPTPSWLNTFGQARRFSPPAYALTDRRSMHRPVYQYSDPLQHWPLGPLGEEQPDPSMISSFQASSPLSHKRLNPAEAAAAVPSRDWPVIPFKFGPPTDGLGSRSKLCLLKRFAFPTYKYTILESFRPEPSRGWMLATPAAGSLRLCTFLPKSSSSLHSSFQFPGGHAAPLDMDVACVVKKSAVPASAFDFSRRDPLDWSSPIIQVRPAFPGRARRQEADPAVRALIDLRHQFADNRPNGHVPCNAGDPTPDGAREEEGAGRFASSNCLTRPRANSPANLFL